MRELYSRHRGGINADVVRRCVLLTKTSPTGYDARGRRSQNPSRKARSAMLRRFFPKMAKVAFLCGVFSSAIVGGCGPQEDVDTLAQEVHTTKAAVLNQTDFNSFLTAVNFKGCTFVIASGTGTFTPSSELSQALYGDPDGSK